MANLKPVDKLHEPAPRPRRGYTRSLYDVVESLNGAATIQEICDLIPTTDDADMWATNNPKHVEHRIGIAVKLGYLVWTPGHDRVRLAPRSYWEHAHREQRQRFEKKVKDQGIDVKHRYPIGPSAERVALYCMGSFMIGLGFGLLLGHLS